MRQICLLALVTLSIFTRAQVLNITSFGAVGNGSTINTGAIQAAIDSCNQAGGGIVLVPPGNFLTGTLFLKSNVTLQLDSGATITGSPNLSDYPDVIPQIRSYTDNYSQKSVFYAEGQNNISIRGKGTFNGNGLTVAFLLDNDHRPLGFRFISCRNISYEGITMRNSGFWMMHNLNVDTLSFKNLTIVNHSFGNNDGITIDGCRNVWADSCMADCNDDPLVLKTSSPIGCQNVEIKNCTVSTYSRAIKIGTETNGPLKNIHLHHCKVQYSLLGPFGTNRPANCGINLSIVDGGSMENVLVENVEISGASTPLFVRLGNRARKYTDTAAVPSVGFIKNVEIQNITAVAASNIPSSVTGISGYYAKDLRLKNIDITFPGGWPFTGNTFVAENEGGKPDADMFGDTLPCSGLFLRHVDSILLQNICFHPLQPDGRYSLLTDDVLNLDSSLVCITSVEATTPSASLKLYPNPAAETLFVLNKEGFAGKLQLFTSTGCLLMETGLNSPHCQLDIRHLNSGVYFLKYNTSLYKFVKF